MLSSSWILGKCLRIINL